MIVKNDGKLLEIDSSTLVHHVNLQKLTKEMFELRLRYLHWVSGNYLLKYAQSFLRSFSEFGTSSIRRVFYGSESIFFIGLKIWDIVSVEFKEVCPLSLCKKVIKYDNLCISTYYIWRIHHFTGVTWNRIVFV